MELPDEYKWLLAERFPDILVQAVKLYGTTEKPGPASNPAIIAWAQEVGGVVKDWYKRDSEPWCGLFMAVCAKRAGIQPPDGFDAIRAKSWAKWGSHVTVPLFGDVLIFSRDGGGHVGFYVGEDSDTYHVLGGNQSDQVKVSRILQSRLVAARRSPMGSASLPRSIRKVWLHSSGKLSTNEK